MNHLPFGTQGNPLKRSRRRTVSLAIVGLIVAGVFGSQLWQHGESSAIPEAYDGVPTLAIQVQQKNAGDAQPLIDSPVAEVRIALNRYRYVRLINDNRADFKLEINHPDGAVAASRLTAELTSAEDASLAFAQSYPFPDTSRTT